MTIHFGIRTRRVKRIDFRIDDVEFISKSLRKRIKNRFEFVFFLQNRTHVPVAALIFSLSAGPKRVRKP